MKKGHNFRRMFTVLPLEEAVMSFLDSHGGKERQHLNALWENWDTVMGPEIASLGLPLGHKNSDLLVGASDNMALQELSMQTTEIIERANAFMDSPFFSRVRVSLFQSQKALTGKKTATPPAPYKPPVPPPPPGFGNLRGKFDPESPVGRCYEAFLNFYSR